jgi:hypothetical protein
VIENKLKERKLKSLKDFMYYLQFKRLASHDINDYTQEIQSYFNNSTLRDINNNDIFSVWMDAHSDFKINTYGTFWYYLHYFEVYKKVYKFF